MIKQKQSPAANHGYSREVANLLTPAEYDSHERAAYSRLPNRVIQAFSSTTMLAVGYPIRVDDYTDLWRYVDVMHEQRRSYTINTLLRGLTESEFAHFQEITRMVDGFATSYLGRRAHASDALMRAILFARLIKIAAGDRRPPVLEVGPGCGYLGMLLLRDGFPYISTDVTQAFYLYQNAMLSLVADELHEMVATEGDIRTIEQPKPGNAIHLPWWKWVTLEPEQIGLTVGIITNNHMLCEMHPDSQAYLAAVGRRLVERHPGGGLMIFEDWGFHGHRWQQAVLMSFMSHGWRLCHNDPAMTAMLPGRLAEGSTDFRLPGKFGRMMHTAVARVLSNAVNYDFNWSTGTRFGVLPNFVPKDDPLSKHLREGREAVFANCKYSEKHVLEFLHDYFEGEPPANADEKFMQIIKGRTGG